MSDSLNVSSRATVGEPGPQGPEGNTGAAGPPGPGVAGLRLMVGSELRVNTSGFTTSFMCDPGFIAISGGAEVSEGLSDATLSESRPVLDGDTPVGWQATGVQSIPATMELGVWIVCVRPVP